MLYKLQLENYANIIENEYNIFFIFWKFLCILLEFFLKKKKKLYKGKEKEDLYEIFLISKEMIIETEVSFFSNSILFVNSVTPSTR